MMPFPVIHAAARARSAMAPVLLTLTLTLALSASTAQAQPTRVPPAPPTPVTPTTPVTPRTPIAPRALSGTLSGDLWRLDLEREALAGLRAIDVDALREMAISRAMIAPRAVMDIETAARAMVAPRALMEIEAAATAAAMAGQQMAVDALTSTAPAIAWSMGGGSIRTQAPAPWLQGDPADSLYREARKALSSDAYRRAADMFKRIRDQYPKSTYAPDAPYWEAFALHRLGGRDELMSALQSLELQQERFPRASTRGDAAALRTRVEGQLARMGDQAAIARLADRARNATSDGCPREQDDERIDALNALAQMDADKAMPILKKVIARREPCTQRLRRQAVWLIASRKQADAAEILLNVAKTDPDKDVREQAVFWMANVPTEEATTMLIDLAKKGEDMSLRKRALYALSRSKSPRAATTLREIALDANADVELRGDALSWYMSGPGRTSDDALGFLKDVYGRADDNRFKQRVMQTIASRRNEESRTFLVEIAQNSRESMEIRRTAIWSLQGSGVTNAQLTQIYDRGTEVEVRKQVIGVLASLKDNGGIDKLLDIARNEKNLELRKQAVTYLSRTKDPRALQLLTEIIDR